MSCVTLRIHHVASADPKITAVLSGIVIADTCEVMNISSAPYTHALAMIEPIQISRLSLVEYHKMQISISKTCYISNKKIIILAANDGPLRTKDGGYILLNPTKN